MFWTLTIEIGCMFDNFKCLKKLPKYRFDSSEYSLELEFYFTLKIMFCKREII